MSELKKEEKHENIAVYFLYAAAAYFGLQLMLKGSTAKAATVVPYKAPASSSNEMPVVVTPSYESITSTVNIWIAEGFPLRKGMSGARIRSLQGKLGVTADGKFGAQTESALLKKYGVTTLTEAKLSSILSPGTVVDKVISTLIPNAASKDTSPLLKNGSKGQDVYRLQKWLGFKDKGKAATGEMIADSIFGNQTATALLKRTGSAVITLNQLNIQLLKSGIAGFLGSNEEIIITRQAATVLNEKLQPLRNVSGNTILGKRLFDISNPSTGKTMTQFQTIDGFRRWVDKSYLQAGA